MFLVSAAILFALWILFSGKLDAFHLVLGVLASFFVALMSQDLLFQDKNRKLLARLGQALRLPGYLVWLSYQILLANIYVLALTVRPKVRKSLDPKIVKFKTALRDEFARFVFATSITLTPGTVTVRVHEDEFVVHAISRKMASGLPGEMEKRLLWVFEGKSRS